ncbi:hypothetical protein T492DRAFT_863943 [Pavlovales sp. CCMP2436]|nr:hypothetical protein T492DRAFT_863943 [Pavlovales sp. CCMP2436]
METRLELDRFGASFEALQRVGTGAVADGGARARAAAVFAEAWAEALSEMRSLDALAVGGSSSFGGGGAAAASDGGPWAQPREAWASPAPRATRDWANTPSLASPSTSLHYARTSPRDFVGGGGYSAVGAATDAIAIASRLAAQRARMAEALSEAPM